MFKFDLSVYKVSCKLCWLLSISLSSANYSDLSLFEVCMELEQCNSKLFAK